MKRVFFLVFVALMTGGGVLAQGSADTIDITPRNPDYYYNDWWILDQSGDTVGNWMIPTGSCNSLRHNYTDSPLRIVGLAAVLESYELLAGEMVPSFDTTVSDEYLLLCDAYPDSFVTKVQIPWNLSDSHRYVRILINPPDSVTPCCTRHRGDLIGRLYTYYFDEPVVVDDSFYVGTTVNWFWNWRFPEDRTQPTPRCYGRGIVGLEGAHTMYCDKDAECPALAILYRVEEHLEPLIYGPGSIWIRYFELPAYTLIFPIVEHPGCGRVNWLQASVVNDGQVRLTWEPDSLHVGWEVAYGAAGTPPDQCSVTYSDSTTVYLDNLTAGERYVVYVRALCRHLEAEYYSTWSGGVGVYIPKRYTVRAEANYSERGGVEGGGEYEDGRTAVLTARAWRPYSFQQWEDGETVNPRHIVVTQDTTLVALFTDPEGIATVDSLAGQVQLTPNPAAERVRVQSGCELRGVEVFDGQGRMVLTQEAEGNSTELDISRWPSGSYVVRVNTECGIASRRLVVE